MTYPSATRRKNRYVAKIKCGSVCAVVSINAFVAVSTAEKILGLPALSWFPREAA